MFTERQSQIIAFLSGVDCWLQGSVLAEMIGASNRSNLAGEPGIVSNNRLGYD